MRTWIDIHIVRWGSTCRRTDINISHQHLHQYTYHQLNRSKNTLIKNGNKTWCISTWIKKWTAWNSTFGVTWNVFWNDTWTGTWFRTWNVTWTRAWTRKRGVAVRTVSLSSETSKMYNNVAIIGDEIINWIVSMLLSSSVPSSLTRNVEPKSVLLSTVTSVIEVK